LKKKQQTQNFPQDKQKFKEDKIVTIARECSTYFWKKWIERCHDYFDQEKKKTQKMKEIQ
jgi:hypothetical protein